MRSRVGLDRMILFAGIAMMFYALRGEYLLARDIALAAGSGILMNAFPSMCVCYGLLFGASLMSLWQGLRLRLTAGFGAILTAVLSPGFRYTSGNFAYFQGEHGIGLALGYYLPWLICVVTLIVFGIGSVIWMYRLLRIHQS